MGVTAFAGESPAPSPGPVTAPTAPVTAPVAAPIAAPIGSGAAGTAKFVEVKKGSLITTNQENGSELLVST